MTSTSAGGRPSVVVIGGGYGGVAAAKPLDEFADVTLVSDYLREDLAGARLPDGSIEITPELRVKGQRNVFALGDVAAADLKTAGRACREAEAVVANIRAFSEGGELLAYEPMPPAIVIPLGPSGGASELPGQDELAGAESTAATKGEHMFVDNYRERFGLAAPAAAAQ